MTDYECGFSEGERYAYRDRRAGRIRIRPDDALTPWARGYWDAYVPRTAAWALTSQPVTSWHDKEEEVEA